MRTRHELQGPDLHALRGSTDPYRRAEVSAKAASRVARDSRGFPDKVCAPLTREARSV